MPLLALQSPPPAARQSALSSVLNTLTSLPSARVKNVRIEVQPPSPRAPASPAGGLAAPATPGFVKLRSEAEGDATPHVQLVVETAVPLFGWRLLAWATLSCYSGWTLSSLQGHAIAPLTGSRPAFSLHVLLLLEQATLSRRWPAPHPRRFLVTPFFFWSRRRHRRADRLGRVARLSALRVARHVHLPRRCATRPAAQRGAGRP